MVNKMTLKQWRWAWMGLAVVITAATLAGNYWDNPPGDANKDGVYNLNDFAVSSRYFNKEKTHLHIFVVDPCDPTNGMHHFYKLDDFKGPERGWHGIILPEGWHYIKFRGCHEMDPNDIKELYQYGPSPSWP